MFGRVVAGGVAALVLTSLAACKADTPPATTVDKVNVVVGFYPLQFITERIGGQNVSVINLAEPGVEPHDMELKPSQIIQIEDADLLLYLKSFQPALDEAVEQNAASKSFDVTTVSPLEMGEAHGHEGEQEPAHEDEEALDPHIWLDPIRLATISDAVSGQLAKADPEHSSEYTARAATLRTELSNLDQEFTAGLKDCQRREMFTSHAAFGYLAARYNLEQIGLTGLTPETEPTPQRLADVATQAKEHGATTIFFETLVSPRVAETLATEVGAKTAVLDPLEGLAAGSKEDYFSVMRANLKALRDALGCT